jgi:amidase
VDNYLVAMATFACLYALLALGLNLVWGMAGMINLGLVGFFGFGAYASALATRRGGAPIVAGLVAALALTAVAGGVMAMVTARMRGDYLAIITLGFSEVVRLVASNEIWLTNGTDGISGIPGPWRGQVAPATFNLIFLGLAALAVAGALVVLQRVRHSPYGRVLRAIRDDDQVTAVAGKHVIRFKVQAFAVSAGILGVAGALWGHYTSRAHRHAGLRLGPERAGRVGRPHAGHDQPLARGRLVRRGRPIHWPAVRRARRPRVSRPGATMRTFAEYEAYDGLGLAELVRQKHVSAAEMLEAAIARVEARNGAVNAVTMPLYDLARATIARGLPPGPFTGVPYLMKDLTASIAGVGMTRGSRFFADTPPPASDSEHVARLKRAGLVIFGRTNTCELGLSLTCEPRLHGPTRNPWDLGRISGGSSGGAAAAVAARMVPMAHATDGFGSIRAPAACCGLVGLKPTRGRNTMAPYAGEGLGGCSVEHAVTLSVRDSAALLDATAGAGPGDPYVAPPPSRPFLQEAGTPAGRLRIAWTAAAPGGVPVDAEPRRVLRETAQLCADLGHQVDEVNPAIDGPAIVPTFLTLIATNTVVNLGSHPTAGRPPRPDEVEAVTYATARKGEGVSAADYVRATQAAHRLGRQMAAFHADWDVLLTPGLASLPPKLGWIDMMLEDIDEYWRRVFTFSPFTVWFNLTGQPAMMLPLGTSSEGLPVAVQCVARYGDEATLFRLAAQLETARPWINRRPALVG